MRYFVDAHKSERRELYNYCCVPFVKKHYIGQRNSATVVMAELISATPVGDTDFLEALIATLLPRAADMESRVRKQALNGLGNLQNTWCVCFRTPTLFYICVIVQKVSWIGDKCTRHFERTYVGNRGPWNTRRRAKCKGAVTSAHCFEFRDCEAVTN